jgi:hypothetical protein
LVLASFGEGLEPPVVVPGAPFFIAASLVVALLFISSHTSVPRLVPARRHVAIVMDDAVSHGIGCAGLSQGGIPRVRNGGNQTARKRFARTSVTSRAHLIRFVNEAAGGMIGWSRHLLFTRRKRTLFEPDQGLN